MGKNPKAGGYSGKRIHTDRISGELYIYRFVRAPFSVRTWRTHTRGDNPHNRRIPRISGINPLSADRLYRYCRGHDRRYGIILHREALGDRYCKSSPFSLDIYKEKDGKGAGISQEIWETDHLYGKVFYRYKGRGISYGRRTQDGWLCFFYNAFFFRPVKH